WHMVGHVQTNKVKYMAPFVSLVHAVDSLKLLKEIDKEAKKNNRTINCLLQIKIAEEDSKFGISIEDAGKILASREFEALDHVKKEYQYLKENFDALKNDYPNLEILSMGMSADYKIAIESGSNMVRIGSAIFGER